jgi:transposase-like protein
VVKYNQKRFFMRKYDEEFRKKAVKMLLKGESSLRQLSKELRVTPKTLRNWREAYFEEQSLLSGKKISEIRQAYKGFRELKAERVTLKRHIDILKKASSIIPELPEEEKL